MMFAHLLCAPETVRDVVEQLVESRAAVVEMRDTLADGSSQSVRVVFSVAFTEVVFKKGMRATRKVATVHGSFNSMGAQAIAKGRTVNEVAAELAEVLEHAESRRRLAALARAKEGKEVPARARRVVGAGVAGAAAVELRRAA